MLQLAVTMYAMAQLRIADLLANTPIDPEAHLDAVRVDREKDLWTFLLSHGMVHGGETASLYRRQRVEPDFIAFYSYTSDPELLADVGVFAARSISYALYAVASIFDWDVSPELAKLILELEH